MPTEVMEEHYINLHSGLNERWGIYERDGGGEWGGDDMGQVGGLGRWMSSGGVEGEGGGEVGFHQSLVPGSHSPIQCHVGR